MSMELHVLLNADKLPSVSEWQEAIRLNRFDLLLDTTLDPHTHSGFVPIMYRGSQTGFELTLEPASAVTDTYSIPDLEDRDTTATFRWAGDVNECIGSYVAAGTLAALTGGVLYDPQDDACYQGEDAIAVARQTIADSEAE